MSALDPSRGVGVVGAGTMGAGIAQVALLAGHPVRVYDVERARADAGVAGVGRRLDGLVAKGRLGVADREAAGVRLAAVGRLDDLAGCGLVVEAAAESLPVKQDLFRHLEQLLGPDCLLATNTSSLSITAIGAALDRPERLVGMHFFNPAPVLRLVEVVSGLATSETAAAAIADTARAWGKEPVRCRSSPGFVVNRVARPFYGEALRLLEERAADPATIDAVLRDAGGFPMGPFELMDLIGLDVNLAVSTSVWQQTFHDPRYSPSPVQAELVAAGRLGRKSGQGFYAYAGDGAAAATLQPHTAEPRPAPRWVEVVGGYEPLPGLLDRIEKMSSVPVRERELPADFDELAEEPPPGMLLPSGGIMLGTDGETATAVAATYGLPVVLLDWVLDAATAARFCVAVSEGCPPTVIDEAVGLLQATGAAVTIIDDVNGLVVARTVARLVDEAHDLVHRGDATARDVDTAMRLGTGYPRGPLAWGEEIGEIDVATLLDGLHETYPTGRYRVSPRLRRRVDAASSDV